MDEEDVSINSKLYVALMSNDERKVLDICANIPKGPLHTVTIHEDTVLHIAVYHKKICLALALLNMVPPADSHKLTWQNNSGSTILHETGTNNLTIDAAKELLRRAPMLLTMTNKQGETPLFYAARHGKTKIFRYLHGEVKKTNQGPDLKSFLTRDDKCTILHLAILSRNYWMAHEIAITHKHLIYERDEDEMTPLQLLSCFPPDTLPTNFLLKMIFNALDENLEDTRWMWKPIKRLRKHKFKCVWAMKLVKLLVKKDTSWENTESRIAKHKTKFHPYVASPTTVQHEEIITKETVIHLPDTPLLLAAKHGCTQIVEEILAEYPQAIEHINHDGRNLLHVSILHRNIDIFDYVINLKYAKDRLRGKIDNDANTLLHMVGQEVTNPDAILQGPAYVLRDNMRLFEKVKNICTTLDQMKLNSDRKTAEEVLYENNHMRRLEAKEWIKDNAESYTVVAVLIATVAFAAAYTVPGGPDNRGIPKLKEKPLFYVFTIADAMSLSAALTSVIMFLTTITSKYRFKDFKKSLIRQLTMGLLMLMVSLVMLMVAFAATLILTINSGRKWTDITLYVFSFFPVIIFIFMYVPFYKARIWSVFKKSKNMMKDILAWFNKPKPAVWYAGQQRTCALPPI